MPKTPPPKRHPYDQWSPDARALDLVGDKWTLLIVRDLAAGPRRFVELQRGLPGISTEQLRSRLNRMVADGLLTRKRFREVPPRVDYALTDRARDLMPVLGALGRWGLEWAWSPPRTEEAVDVTAIFRLAPGLIAPARGLRGIVELATPASAGPYSVTITDDSVRCPRAAAERPDARISGSEDAWIAASGLRPAAADCGSTGDAALTEHVLAVCASAGVRSVPPAATAAA